MVTMATADPPAHNRSDSKDFEDFYREVIDIEQGDENQDEDEIEPSKTPDEGEVELQWLVDTGLSELASKIEAGQELGDEVVLSETSSLTKSQAEAVRKRVATLNATLRKKQKQREVTDIRDVFGTRKDQESDAPSSPTHPISRASRKQSDKRFDILSNRQSKYSMTGDLSIQPSSSRGVEIVSIQSKTVNRQIKEESGNSDGANSIFDFLGVTKVQDLKLCDQEKLHSIALLELTTLFDSHNIDPIRQKPRKRNKDSGIFGVPLQTLLIHDQKKYPDLKVPRFFLLLIQFLEREGVQEEGILRVPGSVNRIKQLCHDINEQFNSDKFKWEDIRPNDAAGVLKQFLRDLPIPLLTFEHLDAFSKVEVLRDPDLQIRALSYLILLLPSVHRETLHMLLCFLKKVADREDNKMTLNNVSMIIAPNLFLVSPRSRKKAKNNRSAEAEMMLATSTASVVRIFIQNLDRIWTVDSLMIQQIRQKYEAENQKKVGKSGIKKIFWFRGSSDVKKHQKQNQIDFEQGLIKVQCPHLMNDPMPFELQPQTTAADIVRDFHLKTLDLNKATVNGRQHRLEGNTEKDRKPSPKVQRHKTHKGDRKSPPPSLSVEQLENSCLVEVGGNIGERWLDGKTNMLALLKVNPNAEWIIKLKKDDSDVS